MGYTYFYKFRKENLKIRDPGKITYRFKDNVKMNLEQIILESVE
jgi:hypothetical protein